MQLVIVRCKHCGNQYRYQVSGHASSLYNADRNQDYCPDCYQHIKNELKALDEKLNSKKMKEREQRYQHAYVRADDVTLSQVKDFCNSIWPNRNVWCLDGWGYEVYPYKFRKVYVKDSIVYRKYLIDTKDNTVVSKDCPIPYRFQDTVNRCTSYEEK